jgi:hypothetical protein
MSRSFEALLSLPVAVILTVQPILADPPAAPSNPPATTAAPSKYLHPEFGNAYTFSPADDGSLVAAVPVAAEPNVDLTALEPRIADVANGTIHDGERTCIEARIEMPEHATPQLVITAKCPKMLPAAYTVTVEIAKKADQPPATASGTPAKKAPTPNQSLPPQPQQLPLQLTMPSGELRPIAAQTIDRLEWCRCPSDPPMLLIDETSGRTSLHDVTVEQVDQMLTTDGTVLTGRISSKVTNVEAGKVTQIPLLLTGAFPFGKAKTNVAVRARELAAQVIVPYEIRTRMHEWLLLPAVFIGLIVGFLLRVTLKRWIDRSTVKLAALDVLAKMKADREQYPDEDFRATIDGLASNLDQQMQRIDATQLTPLVTAADAAVTKAVSDMEERVNDVLHAIEETLSLTEDAARYPEEIAKPLSAANNALQQTRAVAKGWDAAQARMQLAAIKSELATGVDAAATLWRGVLRDAVRDALNLTALPTEMAATFPATLQSIQSLIEQVPVGQPAPDVAAILASVYKLRFAVQDQGVHALRWLVGYAKKVAEGLSANGGQIIDDADLLEKAIDADQSTTLAGPVRRAAMLLDTMKNAITSIATDADSQKVSDLMACGDYGKAAALAAPQGSVPGAFAADVTGGAGPTMAATPPSVAGPTTRWVQAVVMPRRGTIAVEQARTWLQIALAKGIQSLGVAILFSVVGLLALAPAFDGTWRGLLTALFWGYASDISADALTTAAKSIH